MLPTVLKGARTHNLKGIDVEIRPGEVVVVTGVSGAGKSSLAMDTLYAEGQRRFVESFSPYARQFLERLERPPMDKLEPVPAGIAVDRRAPVKSSRSTVATMADLEPYLSALFVREALPVCPEHGISAELLDPSSAAERVLRVFADARTVITYPVRVADAESYLEVREQLVRDGYRRLLLDGEAVDIDGIKPSRALASSKSVDVVTDRVKVRRDASDRLAAGIEVAWSRSQQSVARVWSEAKTLTLKRGLGCPECGKALEAPRAGLFSYESPLGACPTCRGFGRTLGVDVRRVIPDPSRSLSKGAIRPWRGRSTRWERAELAKLCRRHAVPLDVPWQKLDAKQQRRILEGDGSWESGKFPGVLGWFAWLETRTYKMHVRVLLSRYRSYDLCSACRGARLNPTALSYRFADKNLADWHELSVGEAREKLGAVCTRTGQGELARRELDSRLSYLERVGLGYLTLNRQARTLSGGEAQRVTLTAALGTSLHNALFVLDEPTVGLHPSDIEPLNGMLRELCSRANSVIVIEHDPAIISAADRVIELGPEAGERGGCITADGTLAEVLAQSGSTLRAVAGPPNVEREPRQPSGWLTVRRARENNLKHIDAKLPLGVVCVVTGPSGSGKSTLAVDILYRALARRLGDFDVEQPGAHDGIDGAETVRRVVLVDQSPLGRTSRGNAATYTKAWDTIRACFAREPEAQALGLGPSHFSFNVAGGRCEACAGEGYETVEMQFLADVRLICPVCKGTRFNDQVLRVRHQGKSVAEFLELDVTRVLELLARDAAIVRTLTPVAQLGLGYLKLGQPLSTLSGGEAQRLKLARALKDDHRGALYVLDEPSAGLHADEVAKILYVFDVIVRAGGSVLVVEHDLGIVRHADHVIDLGPSGGTAGGSIVAQGTPLELSRSNSRTGAALAAAGRLLARKNTQATERRAVSEPAPGRLEVVRAREHNLKEVCVSIPHGALTVVTGPSGSGKSTLAFDVIFAEGQRRFLETLTPYARQFLPTMARPDVDSIVGVPPSVALEQRTARAGAKSTVATVTEVAHYLRLLYAKLGVPHCPKHDRPIGSASADDIYAKIKSSSGRHALLAPVVAARKGTYLDVFSAAQRDGIKKALCDGQTVDTDAPPRLDKKHEHSIDLVMLEASAPSRYDRKSFDRALGWGGGKVKLRSVDGDEQLFSIHGACPVCGFAAPELDPRWFSFNTKQGRCETCEGDGVIETVRRRGRGKNAQEQVIKKPCTDCGGSRLAPLPRAVRLNGERYAELTRHSVLGALELVKSWRFSGKSRKIAQSALAELRRRLEFLVEVGLDYLALDRAARTLSGGEMQRLRLAAQLGAGLTGALYVLDEPTIGLHPCDTERLLYNLRRLVLIGSTVVVVEHDADTIRAADHLVDLGPGGGTRGGSVVAQGTPSYVLAQPDSPTGRALESEPALRNQHPIDSKTGFIELVGVSQHNLKHVDVRIPVGRFTVVAGVSGSGKSTLVRQVLLPALRQKVELATEQPGAYRSLSGAAELERAISVDQSPIGRTPRSVPATFLGIWNAVRAVFAATPEAMVRGYGAARFSFNTAAGGRCSNCEGQGVVCHEMSFLPDVITPCPSCAGQRFEPRTLEVRYMGRSIGDVLDLTAEQACELFQNHRSIAAPLRTLCDLGAGYIHLGQGSHTLSGGEAQRLKLAAELTASARHEPTLYVLDEPTTGLHLADVAKLIAVLERLIMRGDTLVVIEHHPQVMAGADWIIELGPEGGERGGRVVAQGTPAEIAAQRTPTGRVLKRLARRSKVGGVYSAALGVPG